MYQVRFFTGVSWYHNFPNMFTDLCVAEDDIAWSKIDESSQSFGMGFPGFVRRDELKS